MIHVLLSEHAAYVHCRSTANYYICLFVLLPKENIWLLARFERIVEVTVFRFFLAKPTQKILKDFCLDNVWNKDYLKKCIDTYSRMDLSRIDYILTPTAAYDPIIPSLIYFNDLLKENFGDKVIDIFSDTCDINGRVKKAYKANDWLKDPIHLNSKVSDLLLLELT